MHPPARRLGALAAAALVAATTAVWSPPPVRAAGSISLTAPGTAYTEDFNTLASSGTANTAVPTGWEFSESGTNANTTYRAGTGSDNTGDTYSFGATGNSDRAFGGLRSGSLVPLIGARFTNDTGTTITTLAVAYTGEQWRLGQNTTGRAADRLDVQLSLDATSITTGTWTDANPLDFSSPVVSGTVGALDGNAAANRTAISATLPALSIPAGATFWIRWADSDLIPGADDGLSVDDFSLTPGGVPAGPTLSVNDVTAPEGDSGTTAFTFTVSLSAPALPGGVTFDVATADGTATAPSDYAAVSATGRSIAAGDSTAAVTVNVAGDTAFEPDETFTVSVTNVTGATIADGQGLGTIANDDTDACSTYTPIYQVQGSGSAAAITGNVSVKGVVVADLEGTTAASGFYLQDPAGDGNPATSDGIFVFTGSGNLVNAGDVVRVTGFARERFNQTTINGSNSNTAAVTAAGIVKCGTDTVAPTDVTLPFASADTPERYEGMLVRFPQSLVISEYFNYDRFGEIVLAKPLDGETRPFTGTAVEAPGAAANARTLANSLSRITLDDNQSAQNPPVLRHPNGQPFSLSNRFRGGDLVQNAVGVLGWDFSLYRIFPTGPADYTAVNPRPATPPAVGGSVRVAAMNTLNYFLSPDAIQEASNAPDDPADNVCGPTGHQQECRGWDGDQPTELTRQRDKLLQALAGLDADVIGLNELENTTGVEPLADLAAGLPGYAYVDTGTIGTDAIKVGILYRPAAVTPVGAWQTLDSADDARFLDGKNRPSLAQSFEVNATGAVFTVVVNHLKSKGSDCVDVGDPDTGDGQGNCNLTRTAAAQALVDWIATDPTGSGDPDYLVLGDLNAYAMEDPVSAIRAGADDTAGTADDYTNLSSRYEGAFSYSYTFDGQAGYLDHALASHSILGQVTGAGHWHINSDEPDVLDYDTSFKPAAQEALYEANAYRTSDHDPVIVGLDPVNPAPVVATPVVAPEPSILGAAVTASSSFTDGPLDTHTCTVDYGDGSGAVAGTVAAGTCTGPSHAYAAIGSYTVTVAVTDDNGNTGSASTTHRVIWAFDGFYRPIDNPPVLNQVKAGAAVPVKFSLAGDQGLGVLADGSPTSRPIACTTADPTDPVEETVTAGSSSLTYDAATDTYTYVWKTTKSWAGTCRELSVTLDDGTVHTARFKLTK